MIEKIHTYHPMITKFKNTIEAVYLKYMSATGHFRRKVFCIGFNKTGTSSLHHFFEEAGMPSTHNVFWPIHSRTQKIDKSLFYYQCYSDGEMSDFPALDSYFPNSLFVLNNRNERDWLYSRLKHVMRHNENVNTSNILVDKRYGWMARDFFFNQELAIRKWICERRIYILQARQYFKNKINFIEIDITASEWELELLEFFENNSFTVNRVANTENIIHRNRRDVDYINDQSLLTKYKQLVDDILSEIDAS